jgi:hypothetical protein
MVATAFRAFSLKKGENLKVTTEPEKLSDEDVIEMGALNI